jgi:predicted GTPase
MKKKAKRSNAAAPQAAAAGRKLLRACPYSLDVHLPVCNTMIVGATGAGKNALVTSLLRHYTSDIDAVRRKLT